MPERDVESLGVMIWGLQAAVVVAAWDLVLARGPWALAPWADARAQGALGLGLAPGPRIFLKNAKFSKKR